MDSRELPLLKFAIDTIKTHNSSITEAIDLLIKEDKRLNPNSPFFEDDTRSPKKTKNPFDNASDYVFKLVMTASKDNDPEFTMYKEFFEEHLDSARRDIVTGNFVHLRDGVWVPLLNELNSLKSYAKGKQLRPASVEMHFERYVQNRPKDLLIEIPKWDGLDRVAELKKYITLKGHEFEIFEDALKEWLANIFRRLYNDGAQNRCIILKGDQGLGKDNLIKNLLRSFGPYYAKFSSDRDEREAWSQVASKLVLHIEEFDQTGRLSVAFLKDLITRDYVSYRAPYARDQVTRKCFASFISSVNIDAILRDETGNRRFAIFEITNIDWAYPKDWADQILAQAKSLYDTGYKAKKETWDAIKVSNSLFEQVDMVPELLSYWDNALKRYETPGDRGAEFSFSVVAEVVNEMAKFSGWRQKSILTMLKTNGRSRHTMYGTRYSGLKPNVNLDEKVKVISMGKSVKNYAILHKKSDDRKNTDHMSYLQSSISVEEDPPF